MEERSVDVVRAGDEVAGVVGLDDVRGLAVLALGTEAEGLADLEVIADVVNGRVHDSELVPGKRNCWLVTGYGKIGIYGRTWTRCWQRRWYHTSRPP